MYWITGILGFALASAPFLLGYADNSVAMWTSVILGGATLFVSYLEGLAADKDRWEYAVAALVGLGIIAAPFVLGFGGLTVAMWTSVAIGVLLTIIAGTKLYYGRT